MADLGTSIKKLREKLAAQRKHLDEVEEHIKEMEKAATEKQEAKWLYQGRL